MKLTSNNTKNKRYFRHRFIAGLLCIFVGVSVFGAALSWARLVLIDGVELRLSPMRIPEDTTGDGSEEGQTAPPGEDGDDGGEDSDGGGDEDDNDGGNSGSSGAGVIKSGGSSAAGSGSKVSTPANVVDGGDDADAGSESLQDGIADDTDANG